MVVPGNFLEQNSVCHTGGMAIIHRVTTKWAAKGTGSLALAAGRLAVVIWASHLEGRWFSEAIQAGGTLLETQNIPIFIYLCACKNCDGWGQFIAVACCFPASLINPWFYTDRGSHAHVLEEKRLWPNFFVPSVIFLSSYILNIQFCNL